MPKINIENYEIFIIDYLDRQLSDELTEELMVFLNAHPQLKAEMDGIENLNLQPTIDQDFDGDFLKRQISENPVNPINHENIEEFFVAELESQLTDEEEESLRVFLLSHPKSASIRDEYSRTILQPELSQKWPDKTLLYRLSVDSNESINSENVEDFIIAFHEKELNQGRSEELLSFISENQKAKSSFEIYAKLKMMADKSIVFENKNLLKQRAKIVIFNPVAMRYVASLAAVLLIFLMFPSLLNNGIETLNFNSTNNAIYSTKSERPINPIAKNTIETPVKTVHKVVSKKSNTKFAARQKNEIAKVNPTEPKTTIDEKLVLAYQKPPYCSASNYPYNGYCEVTVEKSTFATQNPDLNKRLVKGFRNLLNIDAKEIDAPENRLTVWDVADIGIKGYNVLTEGDATISRR